MRNLSLVITNVRNLSLVSTKGILLLNIIIRNKNNCSHRQTVTLPETVKCKAFTWYKALFLLAML